MPTPAEYRDAVARAAQPGGSSYLDRRGRYNPTAFRNRFIGTMDPAQRVAESTEADYLKRARSYDPMASAERTARGIYGDIGRVRDERLRDLRDASVGGGRLDTGFYDEDQGEIVRRSEEDFNDALSQIALQTEGLRLRNQEGLGQYAQYAGGRYMDILTGGLDRAEAEAEARRRSGGGFGRFLGRVAGGVVGGLTRGPVGAVAGFAGS